MLSALFAVTLALGRIASAQSSNSSTVVCVAGQCLQGFANTTLGTTLSASGESTSVRLLPGQYTSTTNPQLLHNLLTSSSATLTASPGFDGNSSSSVSLPLTVGLQPGLAIYPESLYAGQSSFTSLPNSPVANSSTAEPISAGSLVLSSDVWVALSTGSSRSRVVLWSSVPDVAQLPGGASGSLALVDIQSSSCSPPCAGAGICSASGTCTCPSGFTGTACQDCAPGFFGPTCQACPAGCASCDEGMTGTGRCLNPTIENKPETCNCVNGECQNGQCSCNAGWTTGDDGKACSKCAAGFFLNSKGSCEICQLGCKSCAEGTGTCITCEDGFTQNANDKTQCLATQARTSTGTVCPDGSFSSGTSCQACSPLCKTCKGPSSNDCIICGNGQYKFNGNCVGTDGNGVCEGSSMVANNNKHECDSCPSKCTSCKIPSFNVASTIDQLQCTGCLPGSFLLNGKCVDSCPSGTFLSPTDNMTCQPCDSSCSTCAGSASFCLTCANSLLASGGKCVSSCPSDTFSSAGSCITCHGDCASCSGGAFNQCSSCPPDRPVLSSGRCLPTCSRNEYFDTTTSACRTCDSSCSSCAGAGSGNCLACAGEGQVLRAGRCVDAKCESSTKILPGLGVCLSELVVVPKATPSGTATAAPLPTVSGIDTPTVVDNDSSGTKLEWWQILLMALGCAFIFLAFLLCWRRRARKQRLQHTKKFMNSKALNPKLTWRERLFGFFYPGPTVITTKAPGPVHLPPGEDTEAIQLMRMRNAEEARHHLEMEKLQIFGGYDYSRAGGSSRAPSRLSSRAPSPRSSYLGSPPPPRARDLELESLTQSSIYSHITGEPRRAPEPRQPVRTGDLLGLEPLTSRFSMTTRGSSVRRKPPPPSAAESYAREVRENSLLEPTPTGSSSGSRNPFLNRKI